MNTQLKNWSSDFGREYTNRNVVDWQARLPAFRTMLSGLKMNRVLEVGCNRGHNLLALSNLLDRKSQIVGIEPNSYAVEIARASSPQIAVLRGDISDLPFKTGYFDLAFTVGVLIHIPLDSLPAAICELSRVSSRFLLAAEYFSERDTAMPYRGQTDLLWKRNFLEHFQKCIPNIRLLRSGYCGPQDGFDSVHWWLMEQLGNQP